MHYLSFLPLLLLVTNSGVNCLVGETTKASQKVALVTGGNKGIGFEICRMLSKEKDIVTILACRDEEKGNAAIKTLESHSGNKNNIICCQLDLTDDNSVNNAAQFVSDTFDNKLDILINNAAICFNDPTLYGKVPHTPFEEQADITIQTNFFGTLKVTSSMIPYLKQSSSPRIVNVASSAGRLSILKSNDLVQTFTSKDLQLQKVESLMNAFVDDVENGTHQSKGWPNTCYGMSKLGIIAMTRVLSRDYPNFMVNSVDPGFCSTDQNNNQGYISAARGANTPFLLATLPESQFVTGKHFYEEKEIPWSYGQF